MLGSSGMELWVYSLSFLLFICLFPANKSALKSDPFTCGPGVRRKGATIPGGDIAVEHGSPLRIYCTLDPKETHLNSSSLFFTKNDTEVSNEFVSKINKTTIVLYIKRPPPSTSHYHCKLRTNEVICYNYVFVGYPPIPVRNFTCISKNWESMNCSWDPVYNDVRSTYRLSYYDKSSPGTQYHCPGDNAGLIDNYCVWNISSEPVYRTVLDYYYFNMNISNKLGQILSRYTIDHYAVVVPNKASKLKLVDATSSSLSISWQHPVALSAFPPGIVPRVMYQVQWGPLNSWQLVNTSHLNIKEGGHTLNITGLKYAHTLYDIRVLLRSATAEDKPKWWSEPATITLRTKSTVPGKAPKTDIGSFETREMGAERDIYIYWQQIPRYMENGDNFVYKVISVEENIGRNKILRNITPSKITKTYAKFTNLTNNSYKFVIVSSNEDGYSKDVSVVNVPSLKDKLRDPMSFTKIAHNHGVFELSWRYPSDFNFNYTIFWCENKMDRPFDCEGYLNWTVVKNVTEMNITLSKDKVYQFAISANNDVSSSGMLWARCTVLPDQARGKLKNIWINGIGSTFIEVSWKLDCFERVKINGFVISYCPIQDPANISCKEPLKNKTIVGDPMHGVITGLKPYTTYQVVVAVSNSLGIQSDPLLNTTLEDAPDKSPGNVKVTNVTNSSISLSWTPPSPLNGVLVYYTVTYNEMTVKVKEMLTAPIVYATLTNLSSYELYNISVNACTNHCSPNSRPISIRTLSGTPGEILQPRVVQRDSKLNVSWAPPAIPRGPIHYYEIKMEVSDGTETITNTTGSIKNFTNFNEVYYELTAPDCKGVERSLNYKISVRAVNIGHPPGPWSLSKDERCDVPRDMSKDNMILIVLLGAVASIIIFTAVLMCAKCVWLRFKAMQNVGVKLPPQLVELNSVFKDKSVADLPISAHVGSAPLKPHLHPTELLDDSTTPDQQLLLDSKLKDESSCDSPCEELDMALETGSGEGHVESSGCGSGHDSVSSSVTAGTHITDSGTEADERPASPDVFSQSPRRLSDLRQRNITGSGSGGGGGGSGEGYSRLAPVPTGYVTLPQGSRTYVSHGHMWPHNGSIQQCHKGYVKAPPLSNTTYSKVSLLPTTGINGTSNLENCDDNVNVGKNEGQLSINPTSSL